MVGGPTQAAGGGSASGGGTVAHVAGHRRWTPKRSPRPAHYPQHTPEYTGGGGGGRRRWSGARGGDPAAGVARCGRLHRAAVSPSARHGRAAVDSAAARMNPNRCVCVWGGAATTGCSGDVTHAEGGPATQRLFYRGYRARRISNSSSRCGRGPCSMIASSILPEQRAPEPSVFVYRRFKDSTHRCAHRSSLAAPFAVQLVLSPAVEGFVRRDTS